ncbi:nucleotide sugar dehydrogenase [Salinisphaera sp.]|uniref:nucleotide sugar dehydrogenase n=1 Tax=Salinisphaera sp. TaxID=1914330 RepID=UPI000C38CC91|nr:nucleotide sugar dehydrogenase [Salinisphaera sp.]MAS10008.1 Vi polysaccharide biosynthesis protein VipA/TviB [Salinisphaera sp.]MAS10497.1 Vi polysaccharide biosynthesis protein VipA/TviB [Salinisphaera sp.]|tara:strand:- start:5191 stop:6477 length:1287 start_codon:yes stop_codon:yes gene_type:complete
MTSDVIDSLPRIAVLGLGYVGLPLAAAFGSRYPTLGFDIDSVRIAQLQHGYDRTREVPPETLNAATQLRFASDSVELADANLYVVTVPTPVTEARVPDFGPLEAASRTLAPYLQRGDVVVYESTVYPGATEERCVPLLAAGSGLTFNEDFFVGYSPERANPGDAQHGLAHIVKVVSGSTPAIADRLAALYGDIVPAGIHKASSIAVAEAAKVIENVQRDINVALVNELAQIFSRLGIDTQEVLEAAGTKWNFLPFRPGLVGGHCIGVDPYYLTYKAQAAGLHPEMILAGRRINDGMGRYIAQEVIRLMLRKRIQVNGARVLVMGLTFKENCPDIRNTRVVDIVRELISMDVAVDIYDPWADAATVDHEYGLKLVEQPDAGTYDAAVVAVAHRDFQAAGIDAIRGYCRDPHVVYDVKYAFSVAETDGRL